MMPQNRLFTFVAALSLLHHVAAQQNCINTCTDSANVLTQLKSCSGCGTDDWACYCRCQPYMNALVSCTQQNCEGSDIENSIVSFCSNQGVSVSINSGSVSIASTTASASSTSSSTTTPTTLSTTGTATDGGPFLSSAVAGAGGSFTATDSSDISSYLATAIPASAQTESSDACFVNTPYSYYSTPTWYSTLPTQVQSYYSSINQGNTAACTLSPSAAAAAAAAGSHSGGHHGLSGGAIAGIVIGSIIAALLLALLLLLCLRRRRRSRRDAAAIRARNYEPRNMPPGTYGNEKGLVGGAVPGQTRQAPYGNGNAMVGAVPVTNGRAVHAPGSGLGGPGAVVGGAAPGVGGQNPDYSHTTTTTVRTQFRPKPKNAPIPSSPEPRPPSEPISNYAPVEDSPQHVSSNPGGRRVF